MDTQLLAWAIDSAVRVAEVNKATVSVGDITGFAEALVAFIDKHTVVPEDSLIAEQPQAPDGWKLVPIEPTERMIDNAQTQDGEPNIPNVPIMRIYKAMLAAAPTYKGGE